MPLEATVTDLEAVSEDLRDEYEAQEDGSFRLKILSGYESSDDVGGLKSALDKERAAGKANSKKAQELERKLGALDGIDPEKYRELLDAEEAREREKLEQAGEWEKLRAQMNKQHEKDLSGKDTELSAMEQTLSRYLVDSEASRILADDTGGLKGNPTLLLPHIQKATKVVKGEDGEYHVRVLGADGVHRVTGDGTPFTVKDLLSEMREQDQFAGAFAGNGASGGGAPAGGADDANASKNPGGKPASTKPRSQMSREDRVAFINEFGKDEYFKIPY